MRAKGASWAGTNLPRKHTEISENSEHIEIIKWKKFQKNKNQQKLPVITQKKQRQKKKQQTQQNQFY